MAQTNMAAVEAILFICGEPIPVETLATGLNMTMLEIQSLLEQMREEYASETRGLEIYHADGCVQLRTKAMLSDVIRDTLKPVERKMLSRSVLETLSVVAYRQPVTRAEIEEIKGVSSEYSLSLLLKRELIEPVGHKDTVGRPRLYGTTQKFLQFFGIGSLEELPQLPELDDISEGEHLIGE